MVELLAVAMEHKTAEKKVEWKVVELVDWMGQMMVDMLDLLTVDSKVD